MAPGDTTVGSRPIYVVSIWPNPVPNRNINRHQALGGPQRDQVSYPTLAKIEMLVVDRQEAMHIRQDDSVLMRIEMIDHRSVPESDELWQFHFHRRRVRCHGLICRRHRPRY